MSYLLQFVFGLLGMFAHAAVKIGNINKRTPPEVSIGTVFKTYFRQDFPTLLLSVIVIFIEMGAYNGYMGLNAETDKIPFVSLSYQDEVKSISLVLFASVTYMAESIIMAFTGKAEKAINKMTEESQ